MKNYTQEELVKHGLELTKKLGRLPSVADFGGDNPAWMTMFNRFGGSLDNLHDAIRMIRRRKDALVKAGIILSLKLKRTIQADDWQSKNFDQKTCFRDIDLQHVIAEFGDWDRFTQQVYRLPTIKLRESLERLDDILRLLSEKIHITENEIRTLARQKQLIPNAVRGTSGFALLPAGVVDLILRIKELQEVGLSDREIKNFMKLCNGYKNLHAVRCSQCQEELGFKSTRRIEGILCAKCT